MSVLSVYPNTTTLGEILMTLHITEGLQMVKEIFETFFFNIFLLREVALDSKMIKRRKNFAPEAFKCKNHWELEMSKRMAALGCWEQLVQPSAPSIANQKIRTWLNSYIDGCFSVYLRLVKFNPNNLLQYARTWCHSIAGLC